MVLETVDELSYGPVIEVQIVARFEDRNLDPGEKEQISGNARPNAGRQAEERRALAGWNRFADK